jgi:hypothetical protein
LRLIDFLAITVETYWWQGAALRKTLPLCDRVRAGLDKSAYIWGAHYKHRRSASIDQCLGFQEHWNKRVAEGEITMDYEAKPEASGTELFSIMMLTLLARGFHRVSWKEEEALLILHLSHDGVVLGSKSVVAVN